MIEVRTSYVEKMLHVSSPQQQAQRINIRKNKTLSLCIEQPRATRRFCCVQNGYRLVSWHENDTSLEKAVNVALRWEKSLRSGIRQTTRHRSLSLNQTFKCK